MFFERADVATELARQAALATTATLGERIFSPLSHLLFVALLARAVHWRHTLTVVMASVALLPSLAYHVCQMTGACFGFQLQELQTVDHVTATLTILLLGTYFSGLQDELAAALPLEAAAAAQVDDAGDGDVSALVPAAYHLNYARAVLVPQVVAVALAVMYYPHDQMPVYVALVTSLLSVAIYHLYFRVERRARLVDGRFAVTTTRLQPVALFSGVLFLALGVWFFLMDEARSTLFHSFWHLFAAAALLSFLEAVYQGAASGRRDTLYVHSD